MSKKYKLTKEEKRFYRNFYMGLKQYFEVILHEHIEQLIKLGKKSK